MIQVNVKPALTELRRAHKSLTDNQLRQGIVYAMNHTIAKAKTMVAQQVRKQYKIRAKDIKVTLKVSKADILNPTASVDAINKPWPLYAFHPSPSKITNPRPRHGVSVNVLGKRKKIQSAFIARVKAGKEKAGVQIYHTGVFARGGYETGKNFTFRKMRAKRKGNDNPIQELVTASPYSATLNNLIVSVVSTKINEDFTQRLGHELGRIAAKR